MLSVLAIVRGQGSPGFGLGVPGSPALGGPRLPKDAKTPHFRGPRGSGWGSRTPGPLLARTLQHIATRSHLRQPPPAVSLGQTQKNPVEEQRTLPCPQPGKAEIAFCPPAHPHSNLNVCSSLLLHSSLLPGQGATHPTLHNWRPKPSRHPRHAQQLHSHT